MSTLNQHQMTPYQEFIHMTRYSRWLPEKLRREDWPETVQRYIDFFSKKNTTSNLAVAFLRNEAYGAIYRMEVMPSMRSLMTAGEALERENAAGFNCSYLAVNNKEAFSEALYILMCFHPDTLVVTKRGDIAIKDVVAGDQVRSFDEQTNQFKWCTVTSQVKTPSAARPKVSIELDNGQTIQCTSDHQWLTSNRSWVEAQYLTVDDDLVAPTQSIYKISHKVTGKSYVGMTNQPLARRLADHVGHAARGADSHLHKAFRKHGVDAFSIELLDVAYTREEAAGKERFWIQELGTYGATGYNSTYGGEGVDGYQWTEEQRQRASENAYERTLEQREAQRKVLAGNQEKINATRQTAEYKEAQRVRNLGENNPQFGKTRSDEWKAKISSGQTGELNQFFGRKHSEETKAKIRASKAATFAKKHAMLEAA